MPVVLVEVQLSVMGSYLPPVFKKRATSSPPQTIISLPVHTAVCAPRGAGTLLVLVTVQLSAAGSYLPPVLRGLSQPPSMHPPQTIISLSVHTAVWSCLPSGAPVEVVAVQLSVVGLYRPPVFKSPLLVSPPQTIISLPVHTAVCQSRPSGALVVLVALQLSVIG